MKTLRGWLVIGGCLLAGSSARAQGPGGRGPGGDSAPDDFVTQMMAFDKNKDGKLTKDEVTDDRLSRLFERIDADKDGSVTKKELTDLQAKEQPAGRMMGGPGGGPGMGGPPMGMPRPGEILPDRLQDMLKMTEAQKKELNALQQEVNGRLEKILTEDQKKQLEQMRRRGPGMGGPGMGGPPPGGGRGGRGPGGPPPGGPGGPGPDGPPPV